MARFTYLLRSPKPSVKPKLAEFLGLAQRPELIKFVTFKDEKELPDRVKYLSTQWERQHFVIGLTTKFLWMEADHPPGKEDAYNCAYLSEAVCNSSPEWKICKSAVDAVTPYLEPVLN